MDYKVQQRIFFEIQPLNLRGLKPIFFQKQQLPVIGARNYSIIPEVRERVCAVRDKERESVYAVRAKERESVCSER